MRRLALALVGAIVAAGGVCAVAASDTGTTGTEIPVSITYDAYAPPQIDVVTGDTVRWTNDSVRQHTVTADDNAFSSGTVVIGATFSRRFDTAGAVPYHCQLHPYIRGEVDVYDVLLKTPVVPASAGRDYPLSGRTSQAPGSTVSIQVQGDGGFQEVATTTVAPDGAFVANVMPAQTASYRAVIDDEPSPAVSLLVLDRSVFAATTHHGRAVDVRTRVTPASPGATVVLQLYLRDHFGWWPVQRTRLGQDSRAHFRLRLSRRTRARVVLTLPDGATKLAVGSTLTIGPGRSSAHRR